MSLLCPLSNYHTHTPITTPQPHYTHPPCPRTTSSAAPSPASPPPPPPQSPRDPPRPLLSTTLTATHALFTTLHTTTALPWHTLIPATAILLRALITTPTTLYSRHRALRTLTLQPLISAWQHPLSRHARATTTTPQAWEHRTRAALRAKRTEILRRHGCQRWKPFVAPLLQLPVWVAASVTLRAMTGRDTWAAAAHIPVAADMAGEGALWFPDLLDADPYMVLPMAFVFLMVANVEMQAALHPPRTTAQRVFTGLVRALPFVALPWIVNMPAALTLYWSTSAAYSLVQNAVLAAAMPRPLEVTPCKPANPYSGGV